MTGELASDLVVPLNVLSKMRDTIDAEFDLDSNNSRNFVSNSNTSRTLSTEELVLAKFRKGTNQELTTNFIYSEMQKLGLRMPTMPEDKMPKFSLALMELNYAILIMKALNYSMIEK